MDNETTNKPLDEATRKELARQLQGEIDRVRREDGSVDVRDVQNPPERFEAPEAPRELSTQLPSIESFFQDSEAERQQDSIAGEILSLTRDVQGKDDFQAQANERFGVTEQRQRLAGLQGTMEQQFQRLQNTGLDVGLESAGQQRSAAFRRTRQGDELARRQRDFLVTGAQVRAVQGQLEESRALANEAVDLEFRNKEQNLESLKLAFDLNKDRISRQSEKRSTALQIQLAERERKLNEEKEQAKQKEQFAINALANGASKEVADQIRNLENPADAFELAGNLVVDPQTVLAREQFNESLKQNSFNRQLSLAQFEQSRSQFNQTIALQRQQLAEAKKKARSEAERLAIAQKAQNLRVKKEASAKIDSLQKDIELASGIMNSPYFSSAFGKVKGVLQTTPSLLKGDVRGAIASVTGGISGKTEDLRNELDVLLNDEALKNLESFKGPTTDFEYGKALEAATAIRENSSEASIRKWLPIYVENVQALQNQTAIDALTDDELIEIDSLMNI